MRRAGSFDEHRRPGTAQAVSDPLGSADQRLTTGQFADRNHDAVASRPGAAEPKRSHIIEHPRIDRLRGPPQRQLAKRRQIGFREEVTERARRFLRKIDFAGFQPLDQLVGRNVDNLDLRHFKDAVRHRLADAHPRETRDDIVQALDVLDVDRRVNVDAGGKKFLDILIALRMAAARRVRVRKLIDQNQARRPLKNGVDVHLAQGAAFIGHVTPGNDFMPADQRFRFDATVRFDNADHHIDAVPPPRDTFGQHLICLADPRRRAEKDLEAPPALPRCRAQKGIRIGASFVRS